MVQLEMNLLARSRRIMNLYHTKYFTLQGKGALSAPPRRTPGGLLACLQVVDIAFRHDFGRSANREVVVTTPTPGESRHRAAVFRVPPRRDRSEPIEIAPLRGEVVNRFYTTSRGNRRLLSAKYGPVRVTLD